MSDRHEMQAAGTHPAPCARHCESTAYEIEIRRLRHDIERHVRIATEATQELEQLRANFDALQHAIVGDTGASAILTAGRLRAELAASREREARMRDAVAWLERRLFDRNWGGTLGAPCDWYMAIGYRHALQKMKGASLLEAVEFAALAEGAQG